MMTSDNRTHELLGGILSVLKEIRQELTLIRLGLPAVRGEYPPSAPGGPYPPGPPYTNTPFWGGTAGQPGLATAGGVGGVSGGEGHGS